MGRWWVGRINIKGVTVRFGFDVLRISQVLKSVENKATGNALRDVYMHRMCCVLLWRRRHRCLIYASVWGFQRCSFQTDWAMREPSERGTGSRTGSTLFVLCHCLTELLLAGAKSEV